ncbi:V-set domain-containing T-cell activation inhibitor 1-like [Notothenia coriiceps]|uniref:V-set domain-containing T-cell activation inhibitor 1-like n=1 Tax=Notothenia coriiceps TaxID=8208 RepID=A0A6I9PWS8_9TELE|nr:PREDICTED: V-set domain-containing T-cell activation inhibitor 1-like [Notothenia coriiceps]
MSRGAQDSTGGQEGLVAPPFAAFPPPPPPQNGLPGAEFVPAAMFAAGVQSPAEVGAGAIIGSPSASPNNNFCVFPAESSVHGSPEKVNVSPEKVCVSAGGGAILPCSFPPNDVFRTLEWSKTDLKKVIVFLFRDNREDLIEQSPLYGSRTNLSVEGLKSGNASLRISNVQAADAGTYQCMRMWKKGQENITEVELFVVGGLPFISTVWGVSGHTWWEVQTGCTLHHVDLG